MYEVDGPDKGLRGSAIGVVCRNSTKIFPNNGPMFSFYFVYNACLGPGKFEAVTCQLHVGSGSPLPTTQSSCRGVISSLFFGDKTGHGDSFVRSYVAGPDSNNGILDSCQNVNTALVLDSDTPDCALSPLPPTPTP
jgi:hypothetical protein